MPTEQHACKQATGVAQRRHEHNQHRVGEIMLVERQGHHDAGGQQWDVQHGEHRDSHLSQVAVLLGATIGRIWRGQGLVIELLLHTTPMPDLQSGAECDGYERDGNTDRHGHDVAWVEVHRQQCDRGTDP